ncbi:MAG: 2-C-methyl-D-erythritol 4-phosphate cytidylyltransferase [Planctomycetes bacterium RBG_13_46_10]|nr:MAG: 2-C-methyl-D-erythritol 4-phosphate cytidylyltransferase [Planctomycetes bacterium RBG_13_46_10]
MSKNVAVIICAAGPSSRFAGQGGSSSGGDKNKPAFGGLRKKQFVDLSGRAVFLRSVELFSSRDDVKQILLAISPEDEELVKVKWGANLNFFNVKICFGGAERFETVGKALELVKDDIDLIAVHDAARCCVTAELIEEVIVAAAKNGAAIPACPVSATIKEVKKDKTIIKTIDRSNLYEAQTPQIFEASLLKRAYANLKNLKDSKISDDSQLVEALGEKVAIVETDSSNIKITRQSDIPIAEAILKSRPKPKPEGPIGPYIEAQW